MPLKRIIRGIVYAVIASVCLGCGVFDRHRGDAYEGDQATWAAGLRPKGEKKDSFFFNEKSRQIEESLGL
jgi:hypothetical protein